MIKKTSSFIALLLLTTTFNTHTMRRVRENQPAESFNFTGLPKDMQQHILLLLGAGSNAESVEEAGKAINAFAQTSKELKDAINDPATCLTIIKNLSKQFDCSDQEAAEALDTEEAKQRLQIQQAFWDICEQEDFNEQAFIILYEKYKKYVDLNFVFCVDRDEEEDSPGSELTLLMLAALKDNCHLIKILFKLGADINKVNSKGESALIIVAEYGHIQATKCLLNNPNIIVDQQAQYGWTALLSSAQNFFDDCLIIQMLLDHGADINKSNFDGITPLMIASYNNYTDGVQCLLKNRKIAINQQDIRGYTALLTAILQQNKLVITMLLAADADPEIADYEDLSPLQAAKQTDDQEIIDLIQGAIDRKDKKQGK